MLQIIKSSLKYLHRKAFTPYLKFTKWLSQFGGSTQASFKPHQLLIVTIAYNTPLLIKKQIEYIKTYIQDEDYQLIIADNSTSKKYRKDIQAICDKAGVEYIPIPMYINKFQMPKIFFYGASHGAAMNWVYYHILAIRKPQYFSFIDHDLLPIFPTSLLAAIGDKDFYGVNRTRGKAWYIWPGFSIFKYENIAEAHPDFLPLYVGKEYLDAGGANYKSLYKHYIPMSQYFAECRTIRLKHSNNLDQYGQYHADFIQIIDHTWLHIINGSNYEKIEGKENDVVKILHNIPKIQERLKKEGC